MINIVITSSLPYVGGLSLSLSISLSLSFTPSILFKPKNLYDGLALTGDLADKVANNLQEGEEAALGHGFGTITDLQVGPDGYLYVLTFAGSIYKIAPASWDVVILFQDMFFLLLICQVLGL